MKPFLSLIGSLIFFTGFTQNFHAFLFCKTNDPELNKGIKANYAQMRDLCQTVSDIMHFNLVDHSVIGTSFKVEKIQSVIRDADIKPNDIVLVYLSSHGLKTAKDKDPFPEVDVPNKYISSNSVHEQLLNKRPRILITIVEACSGYKVLSTQETYLLEQSSSNNPEYTINEPVLRDNFSKLFSSPCNLIISSGQPGMNTWATTEGSIFTGCFIRAFNEITSQKQKTSELWDVLLQRSKDYTFAFTEGTSLPHFPIWKKQYCLALIQQSVLDTTSVSFIGKLDLKVTPKKTSIWPSKKNQFYYVDLSVKSDYEIDSVIYFLHKTMPKPIVKFTNYNKSLNYRISVYGEFPVKAKVYYHNGKVEDYFEEIKFPSVPSRKRK